MAGFLLVIAAALGGAAALFYEASQQLYNGTPWANDVCSTSRLMCAHPEYAAYAAIGLAVMVLGAKFASAMR